MDYFAGLDVSMAETHVCVVTGNGAVSHAQQREHGEHRTFPAVSTVAG